MKFTRDPIVLVQGLVVPSLMALSLLLHLSTDVQTLVDAALLAVGGFVAAAGVSVDAALPALTGLIKAVFTLAVGLGLHWDPAVQVTLLTLVSVAASFWARTQVVAKAPAPVAALR